jgi:hypothetical protein
MSRYTPPCQWDLACVRDAGHNGDHLYPTPDTKPQPSLPDGAEDTGWRCPDCGLWGDKHAKTCGS